MTKRKQAAPRAASSPVSSPDPAALLGDIRHLILDTRSVVATTVNAGLTLLYWKIGQRIRKDILREKRAEYGTEIVASLARQLEEEFGRGFSRSNLFNMVRFAEIFPDLEIVQALTGQLSWTHFTHVISLDDPLKRDFYAEMCRIEKWSTRTLEKWRAESHPPKLSAMLQQLPLLQKSQENQVASHVAQSPLGRLGKKRSEVSTLYRVR
jgi:hypothetical protein